MNRKMPESVKLDLKRRRSKKGGSAGYSYSITCPIKVEPKPCFSNATIAAPVKGKPHIKLQHYPKSKRSYWRVSPLPGKWNRVSDEVKTLWNAAHKFKERMNAKRVVCSHCGKELSSRSINDES